jgi:hypothetical protein
MTLPCPLQDSQAEGRPPSLQPVPPQSLQLILRDEDMDLSAPLKSSSKYAFMRQFPTALSLRRQISGCSF